MKKLLYIALFTIGFFTVNNAQTLEYRIMNSSTSTWDCKMINAGSADVTHEKEVLPGNIRIGAISHFKFPMEFKIENSEGCGASHHVAGPTPGVREIINCDIPAGIMYRVIEVIPFIAWQMDLQIGH